MKMKKWMIAIGLMVAGASVQAADPAVFKAADADGNGKLTEPELRMYFFKKSQETGAKFSKTKAENHVKKMDKDGDGMISEAEWEAEDMVIIVG